MAESGLTLTLPDYQKAVSEYLYGGDGDFTLNNAAEQDRISRIINSGLRQFYSPSPADSGIPHQWSFLRPVGSVTLVAAYSTGTVTIVAGVVTLSGGTWPSDAADRRLLVAGIDYEVSTRDSDTQLTLSDTTAAAAAGTTYNLHQDDYPLPDDFSIFIGEGTFTPADNAWVRVQLVDENKIRVLRQFRGYQGYGVNQPWMCAVQPQESTGATGGRSNIMFWPRVLNSGTFSFAYRRRCDILTVANPVPWGASDHSETIKASILAEAELANENIRGVYWDDFQRKLKASIELDQRANRAEFLGYNRDMSDEYDHRLWRHQLPNQPIYQGFVSS